MKSKLIAVGVSLLLLGMPACALAEQLAFPAHPVTVRVSVHDPDGKPIEGAEVALVLTYYRVRSVEGETVKEVTDQKGLATLRGVAEFRYRVSVEKPGYYRTDSPPRILDSEPAIKKYATGIQEMDIELRPIRNRIAGIYRVIDGLRVPALNTPLGFDAEVGDWVAPHGKGRVSDFLVEIAGYYHGRKEYSLKLGLRFLRPGDGIQVIKVEPEHWTGSEFKFPYEAPLEGYEAVRTWEKSRHGESIVLTVDLSGATNYLFRIRTELDGGGRIKRALYGVISSEFDFGRKSTGDFGVSFIYRLNPNWTRGLEFEPRKTVNVVKP